jgi:hypothetical protein
MNAVTSAPLRWKARWFYKDGGELMEELGHHVTVCHQESRGGLLRADRHPQHLSSLAREHHCATAKIP